MPNWENLRALATDYDGTLATRGHVPPEAIEALRRLRKSGRKALLVTGRRLPDLKSVFSEGLVLFDLIVAENGALLYRPDSGQVRALAEPPPPALIRALERRGAEPLEIGRVVVATVIPHDQDARDAISELGLNWQVIMNRESAMLLPRGIDKATGLAAALQELQLWPAEVAAIGDGENDCDLLASVAGRAAVANAVPSLKAIADIVTQAPEGAGVVELVTDFMRAA